MRTDTHYDNTVKRVLKEGGTTCGAWAQLCSTFTAEILARAGFDWVLIDLEHAPGDINLLALQIQAMQGYDAVPIVRVWWNDFVGIKRILDAGAFGVLVPYVNSREEAEAAVRACKYPPAGIRGIAGSPRAAGFGKDTKEYITRVNDQILVITQIETRQAVDNIDEILEVDDLDGLFIGPMDLATSYGYLGDPSTEEVQETIALIEKKVFASGKFLGTVSANWQKARELYERGYRFVSLMADGTALTRYAGEQIQQYRSFTEKEAMPK